jgi:hypothetical protein
MSVLKSLGKDGTNVGVKANSRPAAIATIPTAAFTLPRINTMLSNLHEALKEVLRVAGAFTVQEINAIHS